MFVDREIPNFCNNQSSLFTKLLSSKIIVLRISTVMFNLIVVFDFGNKISTNRSDGAEYGYRVYVFDFSKRSKLDYGENIYLGHLRDVINVASIGFMRIFKDLNSRKKFDIVMHHSGTIFHRKNNSFFDYDNNTIDDVMTIHQLHEIRKYICGGILILGNLLLQNFFDKDASNDLMDEFKKKLECFYEDDQIFMKFPSILISYCVFGKISRYIQDLELESLFDSAENTKGSEV